MPRFSSKIPGFIVYESFAFWLLVGVWDGYAGCGETGKWIICHSPFQF